MTELESYLETIEPELRVMTRLFGLPESVWDEPKRFVLQTTEAGHTYRITFADGEDAASRSAAIPCRALKMFPGPKCSHTGFSLVRPIIASRSYAGSL